MHTKRFITFLKILVEFHEGVIPRLPSFTTIKRLIKYYLYFSPCFGNDKGLQYLERVLKVGHQRAGHLRAGHLRAGHQR